MPTALFQQLPWVGGLNTSIDESMIAPNQLTVADNLIFDVRGSRRKRPGINHDWDDASNGSTAIIKLHDFWFGSSSSKSQRLVGVSSGRAVYSYNAGTRTTLTDAGTAWSGTLTNVTTSTYNNLCIIAASGTGNVVKKWDGSGNIVDLDGTPPDAYLVGQHQGRLLLNDKANPDRIHYSPTFDHTQWNGVGDSGAIPIGVGDGDPSGITAFASHKGDLFIWKKTKLYRVVGVLGDDYAIELVSDSLGCASQNSVCIVEDDIVWISEKGIHSLSATAAHGDYMSNYLSADIQKTFNDSISKSRLGFSAAAYLPNINSIAFALTETSNESRALTTTLVNNVVYLYNTSIQAWYRWPDLPCSSIIVANDSDKKRFYLGSHVTRVSKTFNGTKYDISAAGSNTAIRMRISTGQLFVDSNPYTVKGLKRFILYYRPSGTHNITVNVKIDNIAQAPENSLSFSESGSSALLGSTFILGSSALGYSVVLGPYTRHIDGIGRGCKITIEQNDIDAEAEIQGFGIDYELLGTSPEIILR